jgi:hypothetical protein
MAYNNQSQGNRFGKPAAAGSSTGKPAARDNARAAGKPELILSSGLFKPKSEKSKAMASVATTVEQDIPAGTTVYIDVYANEEVQEGKPTHKLQIKKRA